MKKPILAPNVGESITEVSVLKWRKQNGDAVKAGEVLVEIESDKATVEVAAENAGILEILRQEGERIPVGAQIGSIDDSKSAQPAVEKLAVPTPPPPPKPTLSPEPKAFAVTTAATTPPHGRVTKGALLDSLTRQASAPTTPGAPAPAPTAHGDRRVPMTRLRARIAERLKQVQNEAAILTSFNEIDMSAVMDLRNRHKDAYKSATNLPLSLMTFFTRACVEVFKTIPVVNASIDGNDIVYHDYHDIGIAVGTERGLVVPIVRNADKLSFVEIDRAINDLALKARAGKLTIAEMSGGTFTITNGGTYGSLLSTPILNPPQSAILGMHKVQDRPVAAQGQVVIHPMMYVALSYDHRLIDGKEAVTFLVTLKQLLENPLSLGMEFLNELR